MSEWQASGSRCDLLHPLHLNEEVARQDHNKVADLDLTRKGKNMLVFKIEERCQARARPSTEPGPATCEHVGLEPCGGLARLMTFEVICAEELVRFGSLFGGAKLNARLSLWLPFATC